MNSILVDWKRNPSNPKAKMILLLFRLCQYGKVNKVTFYLMIPYLILYRIFVEWLLCVELPWKTVVGPGLVIDHGQALVVNDGSIIGSNCTLRHSTTIGSKLLKDGSYSKSPILGDWVDVGSNVCIIGPVSIGNNVKIGAGSVVITDIPDNCVAVGNPARIVRIQNSVDITS